MPAIAVKLIFITKYHAQPWKHLAMRFVFVSAACHQLSAFSACFVLLKRQKEDVLQFLANFCGFQHGGLEKTLHETHFEQTED